MKNAYVNPEMEIVMVSTEDVIATSWSDPTQALGSAHEIEW